MSGAIKQCRIAAHVKVLLLDAFYVQVGMWCRNRGVHLGGCSRVEGFQHDVGHALAGQNVAAHDSGCRGWAQNAAGRDAHCDGLQATLHVPRNTTISIPACDRIHPPKETADLFKQSLLCPPQLKEFGCEFPNPPLHSER